MNNIMNDSFWNNLEDYPVGGSRPDLINNLVNKNNYINNNNNYINNNNNYIVNNNNYIINDE
jgi:hypothetical protein